MPLVNPYKNVDFGSDYKIQSMHHDHHIDLRFQEHYDRGFRHFAYSEYNRVLPNDPASFPEDYYGAAPPHPETRWADNIPEDALFTPNSEHVGFGVATTPNGTPHISSMGSFAATIGNNGQKFNDNPGLFIWDVANDQPIGFTEEEFYNYVYNGISDPNSEGTIGGMKFPDVGGLILLHPTSIERMERYLPLDEFIGTEIYNDRRDGSDEKMPNSTRGYLIHFWDKYLAAGNYCPAFVAADRGRRGCNILLTKNYAEYDCLKAYSEATTYGRTSWDDDTLEFTRIEADDQKIIVETNNAEVIRIIADEKVVATSTNNYLEYSLPHIPNGQVDHTYVRVEARTGEFLDEGQSDREWPIPHYDDGLRYSNEIYSQPIMYRDKQMVDALKSRVRNRKNFAAGII